MGVRPNRLNLEWVVVSKRRLYVIITLIVLTPVLISAGVYVWLRSHASDAGAENTQSAGIRFDSFEGEVRVVRAETREVIKADGDTRVHPGDLVQAMETGRARLTLADGSTLSIRPNSVITIAENTDTGEGERAHVRVAVERGQIKMSTEQQPAETSNTVETRLTKNRLAARTDAVFGVGEDRSEEIGVSAGSVEANTPGGGKTTISAGEHMALTSSGDIARRETLLDTPVPFAPVHLAKIPSGADGTAAAITLRWTHPMAAATVTYRVEIASSPFFVKHGIVFEREHLVSPTLVVTRLSQGSYFWRVQAVSTTGQASEWSEPQKFIVGATNAPAARPVTPP